MLTRRKIDPLKLAYAACTLDCEGSITLSRTVTKEGWSTLNVHVSIANTDRTLVDFLQETFGNNIYTEQPKKLSRRVIYRWKAFCNHAAEFLRLVRPFMRLKGAQADLAIYVQDIRKHRKIPFKEADGYWKRMKALNRGESPAETKREDAETNLRSDSPTLAETPVS